MNEWLIIALPILALGGFAYGVWQHLFARHDAERAFEKRYEALQEDYRQLQEDHGVDVAHLGGLEQDVERLTEERDEWNDRYHQMHEQRDEAREQRDDLTRENAKLHTREKLLIDTLNKQHPLEEMAIRTSQRLEEKGKVDEDTMATNTQTSPKPRKRKATTPSGD